MLAIAKACSQGELAAEVVLVASNRPDSAGIEAAGKLGLNTAIIDHKSYEARSDFEAALTQCLQKVEPDWIVLAGFMRILGDEFVRCWRGNIVNIHPSLLPLYPGLDTHQRALDAGDAEAGASVHIVTSELDAGPVIAQVRVPILPGDTSDTLSARIISTEHELYVQALKQCIDNDPR